METTGVRWIKSLINEYGLKKAKELWKYNLEGKNPYFRESNQFVTDVNNYFNELNPS
jgi:hypothetical protein